jgi:KUP system potassium uptake protein
MFRQVVEDMVKNKEVNVTSRYDSLGKNNLVGDFRFVVIEKILSRDNALPLLERLIMRAYFILKKSSLSEERGFGLDSSEVTVEKYPLLLSAAPEKRLKRIYEKRNHMKSSL